MEITNNKFGGVSISLSKSEEGLAKVICVGMFGDKMTLVSEQELISSIESSLSNAREEFIAKLAIYAKKEAKMKDVSAYLLAHLASIKSKFGPLVFSEIISDISMLKKFITFIRKGKTSRKSFGTVYKRLIKNWLESRTDSQLFKESVGNDPSMADIIKMVHPKPTTKSREALYSYLIDKLDDEKKQYLPSEVLDYMDFCKDPVAYGGSDGKIPKTNIMKIMAHPMSDEQWKSVAKQMTFNQLFKNLNNLIKHNVFKDESVALHVYSVLSSKEEAQKSHMLPYSILMASKMLNQTLENMTNMSVDTSQLLRDALEEALKNSFGNTPSFEGNIVLCIDVSGSMSCTISNKGIATYLDAAAVLALSFLNKNPKVTILPFCTRVHPSHSLSADNSFYENYQILEKFSGGGTDCSAPIRYLNQQKENADMIILVSDNQSWYQLNECHSYGSSAKANILSEFNKFKSVNPDAKLINIDISPYENTQAPSDKSVLLISGFNDSVFKILKTYLPNSEEPNYWVKYIEDSIKL